MAFRFSVEQRALLEAKFLVHKYPDATAIAALAFDIGVLDIKVPTSFALLSAQPTLPSNQVKTWFKNRRTKDRKSINARSAAALPKDDDLPDLP